MDAEVLRAACLAPHGAREDFPFPRYPERSAFKVGAGAAGKVFAITSLGDTPLRVSLKCEPENAVRLRAAHDAIAPGYRLNKRHWITVTLDGSLPDALVRELVEDSYDLVVASLTRAQRAALG